MGWRTRRRRKQEHKGAEKEGGEGMWDKSIKNKLEAVYKVVDTSDRETGDTDIEF